MKRYADAVIGLNEAWQFYRAALTLNDGRSIGMRMPAPWPPEDPMPLKIKHLLWRGCVLELRRAESGTKVQVPAGG